MQESTNNLAWLYDEAGIAAIIDVYREAREVYRQASIAMGKYQAVEFVDGDPTQTIATTNPILGNPVEVLVNNDKE